MPKPYQYDPKKRKLAKVYSRHKLAHSLASQLVFFLVLIGLLSSGLNVAMRDLSFNLLPNWPLPVVVYGFLLLTVLTAFRFPLAFYSGFRFEHAYKLSNQTVRSWLQDFGKETALAYGITLPLLAGLYVLLQTQLFWWVYAAAAYAALVIVFSNLFPVLIVPLFLKPEPFRDKVQRDRLLAMAQRAGVKSIKTVMLARFSEKSNRANAMFAGTGHTKRMILFDTLVDNFTPDETETVVGHELGHYVARDTWRFIAIDAVKAVPIFLILDAILWIAKEAGIFGIEALADPAGLPLLMAAFSAIEFLLLPAINGYSRKREVLADLFALNAVQKPLAQISTERRLADMNLGDEHPHPFVEWYFHSHPSSEKRVQMVEGWLEERHGPALDKLGKR